ncbi:MAG: hypothetical protein ACK4PI_12080 [Tepidisphaerales bacterium]
MWHVQALEPRRLLSGALDQPYNPYNGLLVGQLVSRTPPVLVGGTNLRLSLRLTNTSREPQQGRIDLTYVLSPNPTADAFDAVMFQAANLVLNLRPRGRQVFSHTAVVPNGLPEGEYFIVASVDMGGAIAAGTVFGQSVALSRPFVVQGFTDVTVGRFAVGFRNAGRPGVPQVGVVSGGLRNFGNIPASGTAQVRVYLTTQPQPSLNDQPVGSTTVQLTNLRGTRSARFRLEFQVPEGLPRGQYYVRVEVDRFGLPDDLNAAGNRNVFSSRPFTLGRP